MTEALALALGHRLFGLVMTLAAYAAAHAVWRRLECPPLLHPVLFATILVGSVLLLTGMSYDQYAAQASIFDAALGAVIVLLAVPLYRQSGLIFAAGRPVAATLLVGSCIAIASTLALPLAVGATDLVPTLAAKSATTAVAVEVSERLGGAPALTAVIVIATGIFGGVFGPAVLRASGVDDDRAFGFALGLASHAIGTARAFQTSEVAGAFASLGMILNALLTIALAPLAVALVAP